ncbi:MAG: nucleotidyltransferase domain-containing protein [Bacteroidetes bacterium]|nr:nucleotidyltransferase domain-containing protein [Bacteroidota bacterium]MBU1486134.1 nucleotidyltransferase domain-containing protein [Bacteroidota bacterium]MBU2046753.1 nucleotidyltransferase domain-containing protein [Bacteroidota bacterium]MBU2269535.1 nucleotidyltransferase domain-containing protein [Bacteroidota bacterium]MBU2376216.1 nucleotidyltransferase domain-containing protein [Bacteroidota bacterium]
MSIQQLQTDEINKLCKLNKVKSLFAFGSILREDFNKDSDIDLLVDFEEEDPFKYTDLYFSFKNRLEDLFKRQVDLIEERALRNRFFKQELENTKIKIYGS